MGIFIETPGVLTTVQDGGRYGYEQFGVSPSGPMDPESFQLANILVGNPRDLSALEATMLGPTLRFTRDNIIAITGGDMTPLLDEKPIPMDQAILVRSGSVLKLRAARTGCRTYVAFAGGLDVPEVMGSRATGVQNRVGGLEGRKLAKGDEIPPSWPPRRPCPAWRTAGPATPCLLGRSGSCGSSWAPRMTPSPSRGWTPFWASPTR